MYGKKYGKRKSKQILQADLFYKYSQFPRATLWDQNVNLFFNKTSFTWILARLGLWAPLDTARFELGLQFDLMAAKKISTNYCKLTLHAIFTKLIGSLHNTLKITFFSTKQFLLNYCGRLEQICLQKRTFLWLDLTRPRNGSNIWTLFYFMIGSTISNRLGLAGP